MISLLLVDDEENIIRALRRELGAEHYDIYTAFSAAEAFKILQKQHIDIIVSDVKMPEMDGIAFLSEVKSKYPSINRVFLSGYVEQQAVIDSLSKNIVTAYFPKPWKLNQLKNGINHIAEVRSKLSQKDVLNTINSITNLPTLPSIYKQFIDAVNENKTNEEIVKIIEKDASFATRLLQIVNSAFLTSSNVGSIEKAITLLGFNSVRDILLTFSFTQSIQWKPDQLEFMKEIIEHSFLLNKILQKFLTISDKNSLYDQYKSIGLPHDIGKLIILYAFDQNYKHIQSYLLQHDSKTFYDAEKTLFPSKPTHQELGGYLLTLWNLPQPIIEVALFHHEPQQAQVEYRKLVEVAHYIDYAIDILKRNKSIAYDKITEYSFTSLTEEELKKIFFEVKKEYGLL